MMHTERALSLWPTPYQPPAGVGLCAARRRAPEREYPFAGNIPGAVRSSDDRRFGHDRGASSVAPNPPRRIKGP